jgi:hypothetical protein
LECFDWLDRAAEEKVCWGAVLDFGCGSGWGHYFLGVSIW